MWSITKDYRVWGIGLGLTRKSSFYNTYVWAQIGPWMITRQNT